MTAATLISIYPDFAQSVVDLTYSNLPIETCSISKEFLVDKLESLWYLRNLIYGQLNVNSHLAYYLSHTLNISRTMAFEQLSSSITEGDNILIENGWDLVAGPLRPRREDIASHALLLRAP